MSKCLILNVDHGVEPILPPASRFVSAPEYVCERCGQSFSEPHPTSRGSVCAFDKAEEAVRGPHWWWNQNLITSDSE